nr:hypothetical protein [Mycoplasmopsis synoviae]
MLKISKFVILHWLKKLKNSSEYGYDAKLAQKNMTLEFAEKTTLNLNLKFINLKNLKTNS